MPPNIRQTAARHLVDALIANGVEIVFCVPGESYLAVLDALYDARDRIRLIACRHEAAAANMAEAYGKLTGKPGICFVTRGPGATQGSVGVHSAFQDSTPMILFVGQVARDMIDREGFQELDYARVFSSMAKWAGQIDDPGRTPEYVHRAFATAQNGRRGPVVLALPEDMLTTDVEARPRGAAPVAASAPNADDLARMKALIEAAERPLNLVGGGGWTAEARRSLQRFADATGLPVAATFRSKDLFDNTHPNYAGDLGIAPNPKLAARVRESDLLVAIGPRLGEMTTSGYSLPDPDDPPALIHVHPGAEEIGRVYPPTLGVVAAAEPTVKALADLRWTANAAWRRNAEEAHADFEAFSAPVELLVDGAPDPDGGVNLSKVFAWLDASLPADAIVCNGAGNYAAWLHRFYRHRDYKTQLAPTSGAMGYGFPAALAAKATHPERTVVCAAGDGCFMMAASELATAMQYDLAVIVLVANNGTYGTIRMHQERDYPGRVSGTDLVNPDFAAFARSFGAFGASVADAGDFPHAFEEARASGRPAVIELKTSARHIAPGKTL
ncbi:MAG: thiamine pyrophosphate-binding protein [Parvularculaceae bacterium]